MRINCHKAGRDVLALLCLASIVGVGAVLRLWRIGSKSLWIDEAFSVWIGWQSIPEALAWLVRIDQHPPLYYALLHVWLRLGDDAATVRALSALLSVLNIPVLYLLGRRLVGSRAGLLAAAILALSPFHVRFAQEARMYALLSLNASLATWGLVRLLSDPRAATAPIGRQFLGAWRAWRTTGRLPALRTLGTDLSWGAYVLCAAATVWTHNTAVLFLVATNALVLGLMWTRRRCRGKEARLPQGTLADRRGPIPCAQPASESGSKPVSVGRGPAKASTPEDFAAPLGRGPAKASTPGDFAAILGWGPAKALTPEGGPYAATAVGKWPALQPPAMRSWIAAQVGVLLLWSPWLWAFVRQSLAVWGEFWLSAPTWGTVVGVVRDFLCAFLPARIGWAWFVWALYGALLCLGVVRLRRQGARLALLLTLFLTPLLGEWLVSLWRPIFYDRTLIWASIPLYLLLALGICQLRYRSFVLVATAVVATLSGLSVREYSLHHQKEQWDEAAAYVAERVEPGDLILFHATWVQIPFDFYLRDYDLPEGVDAHGVPVDLFDRGVLEPKMTRGDLPRQASLIHGRERVWLVYSHQWYTDPQGLVLSGLEEDVALQTRRRFYGLEVRLYLRAARDDR
jgi:hypothetical protein